MNTTILSDDIVNLVSKLSGLQSRKDDLRERIQHLENKLNMSHEASLALTNEEHELVNQLEANGFYYEQVMKERVSQKSVIIEKVQDNDQDQTTKPVDTAAATAANTDVSLPNSAQDQLSALLSTFFQQQAPNFQQQALPVAPTSPTNISSVAPTSPTSRNSGVDGNLNNFPQHIAPPLPPVALDDSTSAMVPTSVGTVPNTSAAPKTSSPTSAPGLSIRRNMKN